MPWWSSFNHSEITLLSNFGKNVSTKNVVLITQKLHYSQTEAIAEFLEQDVLITQKLHYSQTPNCIFTQNTEFKDLREFSAYEAGVILASQLKHA